ncbi:ATPase_AAA_core domain-containing protein [Haematococcus lacustris]|uniref:ATPase_AAA_core domain-containing protein n=1 Tax=Haematococcus lacustris TaxID=44745 RepID=A0A699Z6X7_HAELA|nr:ATPase_AAA_core domain-containing protein [Haematococcus lacustris]
MHPDAPMPHPKVRLVCPGFRVEAVVMSAGELEHEWAGTPGRLIRERYKKAGELSKVRGKFSVLMINDIDAGLGHFDNTQVGRW